jgi:phage N-6-adenine-methyltransferase
MNKMTDYIASELEVDEKNAWGTDPLIFAALNNEFNFSLDAAASESNHLVQFYYTKDNDALKSDWLADINKLNAHLYNKTNKNVWVNPPYGRGLISKFMQKAIEEKAKGVTTVMLVPATLEANWLPINDISEIRIITGGRLSFMHPITGKKIAGNTKGSMFIIFRPSESPLITSYVPRHELLELGRQVLRN